MANTNFKVFAESSDDVMPDVEYSTDPQRINGVEPGLAKSNLHNKLYRQGTIMAAAIAQVLTERGFDAMDNNYDGLVTAIRQAFVFSINDKKAGADGNIDYTLLSLKDIYPVGSIYMSVNATDPSALFPGTTWQRIAGGRCLLGADDVNYKGGATGGSATVTLTTAQMPNHSHGGTISSNGGHKHNRGTMNITGAFDGNINDPYHEGAFYNANRGWNGSDGDKGGGIKGFDASRSWTGETNEAGAHSHALTINSAGSGQAHNNMQPYLVVYIWKRIS